MCNADGTRTYDVSFDLDSPFSYSAELRDSAANILGSLPPGVGPRTLSGTHDYVGGPETFTVIVTSPLGCDGFSAHSVGPTCPKPCPEVTLVPTITTDSSTGENTVVVTATLTSTSPDAFAAELNEDGTTLDSGSGVGSLTLTSPSEPLPTGTSRTFRVVITSPTPCRATTLEVPAPGSGDGDGDGGGSFGCDGLLWLAFTLITTALVLAVLAVCLGNPAFGITSGVVLAVGLLLFALWALFCSRLPGACAVLRTLECIVEWIIAIVPFIALLIGLLTGNIACGLAVLATEAPWGLFLIAIQQLQIARRCPPSTTSCFLP